MKLAPPRLAAFLKSPGRDIRAALFYGPDAGLVRERAESVARAICPDLADPFRVAELTGASLGGDPARLADELAAQSLMGGRRVVRVREAGDASAPLVADALATARGDTLLVIEAGELATRSALRKLFEAGADLAAVACYADSAKDLEGVIRAAFAERRIEATREAIAYLVDNLGSDRMVTRSELEKLMLYAGDGGRVGLEDAAVCVGDSALLSLDDAVMTAADGDPAALERALFRCLSEGESPVTILRAAQRHFQRLHLAAGRIATGASAESAMASLRPPVFFMHQRRFAEQLRRWPLPRAARALELLTDAELDAKRTLLPPDTICRQALLDLARAARS